MDNPLSKVSAWATSFLNKEKNTSALGVDIGTSSIKVVQIKKKGGKAVLETYGALSLGPYAGTDIGQITNLDTEKLAQALLDVMKESNVTTVSGAIAIPSSASLISVISLPGTIAEDKLNSIIPTEARKYIPVPITEVSLDWWVMPKEVYSLESGKQQNPIDIKNEILIAAIHNDTLAKYRDLLTKTNISSDFFEIEIFSSIRSNFTHEIASVVLIDFGASKTKLSIVEYGLVRVFHIVNRGGADITRNIASAISVSFSEAEKLKREVGMDKKTDPGVGEVVALANEFILNEASSIVLAYEKKYNKTISKVILSGGGSLTKGLAERAQEVFNVEVVYGNPFSKIEAPAFLDPVLSTSGPEFSVAIGLALRQLQ